MRVEHAAVRGLVVGEPTWVTVRDASGDPVDVVPGLIDDAAEWVYMHGQCLALAVVLAERTGWPMHLRVFADGDGYEDDEPVRYLNLRHAYVQTPDGPLLDIRGVHDPVIVEEHCRDFDSDAYLPPRIVPAAEARGLLTEFGGYLEHQDVEVAATFIAAVLARRDEG